MVFEHARSLHRYESPVVSPKERMEKQIVALKSLPAALNLRHAVLASGRCTTK